MHVHLRQHLHALQQNPLSALVLVALLVWLLEGMGAGIAELMSSFDRPASATAENFVCTAWFTSLWYWCQCNTKLLIMHCMHDLLQLYSTDSLRPNITMQCRYAVCVSDNDVYV